MPIGKNSGWWPETAPTRRVSVGAASKDKGLPPEGGGGMSANSTGSGPATGEADVSEDPGVRDRGCGCGWSPGPCGTLVAGHGRCP